MVLNRNLISDFENLVKLINDIFTKDEIFHIKNELINSQVDLKKIQIELEQKTFAIRQFLIKKIIDRLVCLWQLSRRVFYIILIFGKKNRFDSFFGKLFSLFLFRVWEK